jgi:hypothetical protein
MDRPESAATAGVAGASVAPTIEKLSINNKPNAKHIAFLPIFIIKTISYVKLAKILAEKFNIAEYSTIVRHVTY